MLRKAAEKDRSIVMDYCLKEPNINLFIIGDIENFGFDTDFQDVWIQEFDGQTAGIVLRYHDNFVVYSRELNGDFNEIKNLLDTQNVKIISGQKKIMDLFYPLVKDKFSKRDMYFCELADKSKLIADNAEVITARSTDVMEIALVYEKIGEFSGIYSQGFESRYKQIASRIETGEGIHMLIKQDNKIVSHGNTTAETSVSGMVGGILTLPEYRNRGYASKIVSALCQSLSDRGKSACLFFDNPDAGKIYHRLGFKDIDMWSILGRK
jgi:predicted GNAT family acetyltransferase